MAAGDRLLDTSGNRILDASGNVMLDDAAGNACCCDTGNCSQCPSAPNTFTATASGVTVCGSCTLCGGLYFTATGSVNGTYTLPKVSDCIWEASTGCTVSAWSDSGCTVLVGSAVMLLRFVLHFSGTFSNVKISNATIKVFDGSTDSDCATTISFTNTYTACCGVGGNVGHSGSVSIS